MRGAYVYAVLGPNNIARELVVDGLLARPNRRLQFSTISL